MPDVKIKFRRDVLLGDAEKRLLELVLNGDSRAGRDVVQTERKCNADLGELAIVLERVLAKRVPPAPKALNGRNSPRRMPCGCGAREET